MFYFIIVYFGNFRGGKNRGFMDPVGRSTEGVHGPGVHVLYFPIYESILSPEGERGRGGFLQFIGLEDT